MRHLYPLVLVFLAACTPQDDVVSSGKARFSAFPEDLYNAFAAACNEPSHDFQRPRPSFAECRELLPPDLTASVILSFDGTIEDLPRLVISFTTTEEDDGYVVQNDIFLNVPQKNATDLKVRMPDPRLSQTIDRLYVRAGGVPVLEPSPTGL